MATTVHNQEMFSTNWSGAAIQAPAGKSFGTVSAEWVVPKVSQVPGQSFTDSAEWVGLDGYNSNDVCQAGVLEVVQRAPNGATTVSCTAWDEWYPNGANLISPNAFAVNPGDTIQVSVETSGAGATRATFLFDDLTTDKTYTSSLTAPTGVSLDGNSAEFVVETPYWSFGNREFQPLLTDFVGSPVVFQNDGATYANGGGSASLSSAIPIAMVSNDVPGAFGSYVQEAYGSVLGNTVSVTEDPYWTTPARYIV